MAGVKRKQERSAVLPAPQAAAGEAGGKEAGITANRAGARQPAAGAYTLGGITDKETAQSALTGARYRQSQYVQDAAQALRDWQQNRPAGYTSAYQTQIDTLLGQLTAREPFHYDYGSDPLYQQYARLYTQNARLASEDAAAQAAALTGGYGSSYAASVAQQAYQQQMDGLNAIVPTLYAQALREYNDAGQALYDQLAAYSTQEQAAQDRYDKDMNLYNTQLDYLSDAYSAAYAQDYGAYGDYLDTLAGLRDYYAAQEQYQAAQKQQAWENQMAEKQYQLAVQKAAASGASGRSGGAGGKAGSGAQNAAAQAETARTAVPGDYAATPVSAVASKLNGVQAALRNNALSASAIADATMPVPYGAARARASGKSDAAIRKGLEAEGYSKEQIEAILRQL